jgi:arginine N-succinyltransferase
VSFRIRPARNEDFSGLYELAKLTGGGFTNLPPDRGALVEKLMASGKAFGPPRPGAADCFVFVLENVATGQIRGTCQVFSRIGGDHHFYSYRIDTLSRTSLDLGRTFEAPVLHLCHDFDGYSEVGGLFLHPDERAGGMGSLLARSRYLFVKSHRERFASHVVAELRGVIDDSGGSRFWDAIAGLFFGMSFKEADGFNAQHGTHFIFDLMPDVPILVDMLPKSARDVMGQPHPSGRAAMRMLELEGFESGRYIDIFDGGPTMSVETDRIRTIRESVEFVFAGTDDGAGQEKLLATGELLGFRACHGRLKPLPDGTASLDPDSARLLGLEPGQTVLAMGR